MKLSPVLIWSLMLLISATGLFFSRKWIAAVFSPYFSRKPAIVMPHEIAKPPAPASAAISSAPDVTQAPALEVPPESADLTVATPSKAPIPVPVTQTGKESDSATPSSQALLQLEVGISEKCWISIDRDGSPAVRKLMNPGEVESLNANEQFRLIVGNAGGAHLRINGKPTKPLGKSGEVVKILINEKTLQDLLDQTAG